MNWGPFNSEESGRIIADFTKNQLLPILSQIRNLTIECSEYDNSIIRSKFKRIKKSIGINCQH
jgi:hypothetical protein